MTTFTYCSPESNFILGYNQMDMVWAISIGCGNSWFVLNPFVHLGVAGNHIVVCMQGYLR